MSQKQITEPWEEILPSLRQESQRLKDFSDRETVVVLSATLDALVFAMLEKRLAGNMQEFLEDLPFGDRITLAKAVGLLCDEERLGLKAIKDLRNLFAHKVLVDFSSEDAQKQMRKLVGFLQSFKQLAEKGEHSVWADTMGLLEEMYKAGDLSARHLFSFCVAILRSLMELRMQEIETIQSTNPFAALADPSTKTSNNC